MSSWHGAHLSTGTTLPLRKKRRPSCRWEDSIVMDLRVKGREGVDWIYVAQDSDKWQAVGNTVMNLWVP
jgi:hypothetical protein